MMYDGWLEMMVMLMLDRICRRDDLAMKSLDLETAGRCEGGRARTKSARGAECKARGQLLLVRRPSVCLPKKLNYPIREIEAVRGAAAGPRKKNPLQPVPGGQWQAAETGAKQARGRRMYIVHSCAYVHSVIYLCVHVLRQKKVCCSVARCPIGNCLPGPVPAP